VACEIAPPIGEPDTESSGGGLDSDLDRGSSKGHLIAEVGGTLGDTNHYARRPGTYDDNSA